MHLVSPQTASRNSGDCTFEENMCNWHNPLPNARVDDFDWLRQYSFGGTGPTYDHTKKTAEGIGLSHVYNLELTIKIEHFIRIFHKS